jgi:hypothetical protein
VTISDFVASGAVDWSVVGMGDDSTRRVGFESEADELLPSGAVGV